MQEHITNIIVFGRDQREQDANLRGILERLKQYNIRLKKEKCSFSQSSIKFYGHARLHRGGN